MTVKTIKPLKPNFKNMTTYDNQGSMNNTISANLKIITFCSVTYGSKVPKILKPSPAGETSIPVFVTIARKRPLANAGTKNV
ncbi:MAG: hypothetical protein OEW49_02305 [Nitrosopumilus sp.]|nr:hypothetical protein [Nitrosopumilus sp.]